MTNIAAILPKLIGFLANHINAIGILIMISIFLFATRKREKHHKVARKALDKAIKSGMNEPPTLHPEIDLAKCAGCGACTKVCPEGDILKLVNHKAVLVSPSKCVGHGECERACPFGAIDLVFGTKTRGMELPRVASNYETNVPGLYIAGELGGMGLIRNAVKQGVLAVNDAIKNIKSKEKTDCEILIVGAGPAGFAACLSAIAEKTNYICIEQNTLGGTVFNFPRQKVVMTHPAELPGFGLMKFKNNKVTKEELLDYWTDVGKKAGVKIRESTKFEGLEKVGEIFKVKTSSGELTAKKVILCLGVRGSPRRLGLKNEDTAKVAYNLIDPEQYQGKHVAVVGGGNAGVEAAQYLGKEKYGNKVILLVRGEVLDRCNDENKAILEKMRQKGLIDVWYNSSVKEIDEKQLIVTKEGKDIEVPNDFLFIFAGAEMPFKFLMSLGIQIDKSFGDRKMKSTG